MIGGKLGNNEWVRIFGGESVFQLKVMKNRGIINSKK